MRADMVEQSWRIVQPVLDAWAAERADFPNCDSGSDGPNTADELLACDPDRTWRVHAGRIWRADVLGAEAILPRAVTLSVVRPW
jgi:hypothetical protein